MKALIQRVSRASVSVEGSTLAAIGRGLVVLLGVGRGDAATGARALAEKVAEMRVFDDEEGKMNLSSRDVGGEFLVVSQFTLYADTRKGRRPSFTEAAPPDEAEPLVREFAGRLREMGFSVGEGRFQARMLVEIANDGPVTLMAEVEPAVEKEKEDASSA